MKPATWCWLSSAVLAAYGCLVAANNETEAMKEEPAKDVCPVRLESRGKCEEGDECHYQVKLPPLTVQLPKQYGRMEEVFKEVQNLKEIVNSLKKCCHDCKLQADDNREPGRNGLLSPGTGALGEADDNRVRELESEVNKLSSDLRNTKEEIDVLQGRLEKLNLVNMNNIENYVDNKVANLTFVVNNLDGKCSSKCPNQEEVQSHPVQHLLYKDCSEYYTIGKRSSETYRVTPDPKNSSFEVYCDMETMGGGWTVLQARLDGSTNFTKTWQDYKRGFGNLRREFWLGNDKIHLLTKSKEMILRIDLEDFNGVKLYALYDQFYVANEFLKYRLHVGNYNGTAGDALRFSKHYNHDMKFFTTPDKDNDRYPSGNCGLYYSSGWWFDACLSANLNGKYYHQKYRGVRNGIFWGTWPGMSEAQPGGYKSSFKKAKMMIRPKHFKP
ncbi:fibrinogen like 2 [Rhinolophus ferrumequinum]|uniref:Fibroleukin n=1 Tax=Rhinolophus ferrumequinum TaxID=59479 RepID=A0A671ETP9_RHIFE|nr:fibroleukin [Rhinolophus ferrumequinum]KAF6301680.1 fibrinogen like 2 [Rhinolophus ferrumequinum]